MNFLKYFVISVLCITCFVVLIISIKSRKPIRFLFLNAFIGILSIFLIHFTNKYTGVDIPINEFTVVGSSVLGVPCVIGFLILNFILM